jgi:ribosome recycling factor
LVENIVVSAYGGAQRLKVMELATITVLDTHTLAIEPWDKSIIGEIRQAILAANVGMNPAMDGEMLRISMPQLTGEDREKYIKLLGTKLEHTRIVLRQIRGDVMKDIKLKFEAKEITEDDKFAHEEKLQKLTDEFVAKVEERGKAKEAELRQI